MKKMNLLPTEERVAKLSSFQWALLYKYINYKETKDLKNYLTLLHRILGTDIMGEGQYIPLAAFMNVDMYKELIKKRQEDEEIDPDFISPDMDLEAEDIFQTDIEAMLTDEDREKIKEMEAKQLEEQEKIERMLGVQIIKNDEEIEDATID
jgi:ribosomal protein S18